MRFYEFSNKNIREGGHVFQGKTQPIKREFIEGTVDNYFKELAEVFPKKRNIFNRNHMKYVGSVGKKPMSGDIDFAIDISSIVDHDISDESMRLWDLDPVKVKEQFQKYKKRAKSATDEEIMMRAVLAGIVSIINEKSTNLYCDEKKITPGNIFGFYPQYDEEGNQLEYGVQIDWMVGNIDWLTFSYYSKSYTDNVKGLHRTQLVLAMFQNLGYSFNHVKGVTDKATKKVVATNPKDAVRILEKGYNIRLAGDAIHDYHQIMELVKTLPPKEMNNILAIYFKILDSTRADIPLDLQDIWRQRKDELNLKGKFLPQDSNLAESGVTGNEKIQSRENFKEVLSFAEKIISKFPGFVSVEPTGSYNSDLSKTTFGDQDLITHIDGAVYDNDKKLVKKALVKYFSALPNDIVVPFISPKHSGKRFYNSGEIVTISLNHPNENIEPCQVDYMIAMDESETKFKKNFLDMPAPKQGLVLGLVKTILIEEDPASVFKRLNIRANANNIKENQEWEFNLSSKEIQLRLVTYAPDSYKQIARKIVWTSQDWDILRVMLNTFNLDDSFDGLIKQAKSKLKNPRSSNRMAGVFKSMISVKSGELGKEKGINKQNAIDKVQRIFGS